MTIKPFTSPAMPLPEQAARLQVQYVQAPAEALLTDPSVLAVIGFGPQARLLADPRCLRVPLQPHAADPALLEVWRANAPVRHGRDADIAWASDGQLLFGAIQLDEGGAGIELASEHVYRRLRRFVDASEMPQLLRIWNYLDAITVGDGDAERYRRFCVGRARGLGDFDPMRLPAATAIGRCDGTRGLQVYWLAAREPGIPVENPRQVSAYHYPREYGPQSPSFARAMLPPAGSHMPLLLSGTAAVVGHASQHAGQLLAQIDETFANFDALIAAARRHHPGLPQHFGPHSHLKVYVRDARDLPQVAQALQERLGNTVPYLILHAAICRRELAIEIDGMHG